MNHHTNTFLCTSVQLYTEDRRVGDKNISEVDDCKRSFKTTTETTNTPHEYSSAINAHTQALVNISHSQIGGHKNSLAWKLTLQ